MSAKCQKQMLATAQTEKSGGAKSRTQQAGHADGIDGAHHDVEDPGNEERATVLGKGERPSPSKIRNVISSTV